MAISEFETRRCEKLAKQFVENIRPPAHVRHEVDYGFRVIDQSVELYVVRPHWQSHQLIETPFAKATYQKDKRIWKIYWQRADQKWHPYVPTRHVDALEDFFAVVRADEHACFFG